MSEEKSSNDKSKNWFAKHKIITIILVIFVLIVIGSVMSGDNKSGTINNSDDQQQNNPAQQQAPEPTIVVTPNKILGDYEANAVAADAFYKNKLIEVSGTVESIGKDILDTPYVALQTGNIIWSVQCMFDKADASQLVNLTKNQKVTLVGKVTGKMGNILVDNCRIK